MIHKGTTSLLLVTLAILGCKSELQFSQEQTSIRLDKPRIQSPSSDWSCWTNPVTRTVSISAYHGAGGDISVPANIGGFSVTETADWIFKDRIDITSINLPEGLQTLGNHSFWGCKRLTKVILPRTLVTIHAGVFVDCYQLQELFVPGKVTQIGALQFPECSNLQSITVAADNTQYASFNGVLFDKNRTVLIQFPPGRSGVYVVPDGVTTIKDGAFFTCRTLERVTIAKTVTNIGDYAFAYCTNLVSVSFLGDSPRLGTKVFGGPDDGKDTRATVYYQVDAKGWSNSIGGIPAMKEP